MKISEEARELVKYVFGCHTCKTSTFPSPTYHHDLAGEKVQSAINAAYNRGLEDAAQIVVPNFMRELAKAIRALKVKP